MPLERTYRTRAYILFIYNIHTWVIIQLFQYIAWLYPNIKRNCAVWTLFIEQTLVHIERTENVCATQIYACIALTWAVKQHWENEEHLHCTNVRLHCIDLLSSRRGTGHDQVLATSGRTFSNLVMFHRIFISICIQSCIWNCCISLCNSTSCHLWRCKMYS